MYIYLVHSRRLGTSLGINLTPHKTCSLDCIYCEAGATTLLTMERKPYIPANEVLAELDSFLEQYGNIDADIVATKINKPQFTAPSCQLSTVNYQLSTGSQTPKIDYITFSGLGEPTLNSEIGTIIRAIKSKYPQLKLALITNSTTLCDESIHSDLLPLDLIMPSLDAVSEDIFHQIDRPHHSIKPDKIISALIAFRKKFANTLWLEIFFIDGLNDTDKELALLKKACEQINPDTIQLNSLDRCGVIPSLKKVSRERLKEIQEYFLPLRAVVV